MLLDAAVVAIAVRTTARISAVLLAANLIVAARRLAAVRPANLDPEAQDSSPALRRRDLATFAAFLVSHTIHFGCVALLALATGGESIRASGGWTAALVVAGLFYLGGWGVLRGKRRPGDGWTARWSRRREIVVLLAFWLIFFQAFAPRAGTAIFAVLSVGLLYSLVRFLTAALKSSTGASRSPQASV